MSIFTSILFRQGEEAGLEDFQRELQIMGVAFLFGASLLSLFVKNNHAAEPFYQGKTLRVIVASAAGAAATSSRA